MAGREPNISAFRVSNLGNVSALAAAFGATVNPSRFATSGWRRFLTLAALYPGGLVYLDMKTPSPAGQASGTLEIGRNRVMKLLGGLEKRLRTGAELLAQANFFRLGGSLL